MTLKDTTTDPPPPGSNVRPGPIAPPTGKPLMTLAQAQYALRLASPLSAEVSADLTTRLQQASDAIRSYLKSGNDPTWDDVTAPSIVAAAVGLYLTNLWQHRGDDAAPNDADAGCWAGIKRLLIQQRDPALA